MSDNARERKPLMSLLAANAVSQVGNSMLQVAGPWFVLQSTGSAAKTGLLGAVLAIGTAVPMLGGPLIDRVGFKRASVIFDVLCSVTIATVPLLHAAGLLEFWHLLTLVFVLSSFNSQGDTARYALVPDLAQRAEMSMERANSADRAVLRAGQLIGPLVAGGLIVAIGAANVLLADAVTFALSAAFVAFGVRGSSERTPKEAQREKGAYLAELKEGFRFIGSNRLTLGIALVALVGNFLDVPLIAVVLPVYVDEFYGSAAKLGVLLGAIGGGALLGTIAFGAFGHSWPRYRLFAFSITAAPLLAYGVLASTPPLIVAVIAVGVAGFLAGPLNPLYETVAQESTPPELLGRMFGSLSALSQLGIPFGTVLAGMLIQRQGVVETLIGMMIVGLGITVAVLVTPVFRQMDALRADRTPDRDVPAHPGRIKRWMHHG